jgi:hypothetical protein
MKKHFWFKKPTKKQVEDEWDDETLFAIKEE